MVALKQERLALLPPADRADGLIIPLVLRGKDTLPEEVAQHRMYEDFSKFLLADIEQSIRNHAPQIAQIAAYIDERCSALEKVDVPMDAADHFELPSDESVLPWLNTLVLPSAKFPGSEN